MQLDPTTAAQLDACTCNAWAWCRACAGERPTAADPAEQQQPVADGRTARGQVPDPVALLADLMREVEAARVLVTMSREGDERRRAALDGLALAHDVIADARAELGGQL